MARASSGFTAGFDTLLLVIDRGTARQEHWRGLNPQLLGSYGIYQVWRLDRAAWISELLL